MSMNIQFIATRKIKYKDKSGCWKTTTQTERFKNVYRTPTNITYLIHESSNKIQAYVDWVHESSNKIQAYVDWVTTSSENWNKKVHVYDYDGEMDENFEYPIIGTKILNPGDDHIKLFLEWVDAKETEGFTIQTEVW